jgi:hypothetical protein
MAPAYPELRTYVQHLAPTWRKPQHENFARLLAALLERPTLCLSELARAWPEPDQPLHGRLKRLGRFLDNPRLDELALCARWLKLSYRLGANVPGQPAERPVHPILLDTTYFEPFAALIAAVPCGSRALPVALTTYHRTALAACFPPRESWPDPEHPCPPPPRRPARRPAAAARPLRFLSQNHIEQRLLTLVWHLLSPALRGVLVADRGFARADLFRWLLARGRDFVVRIDAATHVRRAPGAPSAPAAAALALPPGGRRWCPGAAYHREERVPVHLLAVWDAGQAEPWYLATTLERPDWAEALYRWRMRLECTNRDAKTGVLLREGGDRHALRSVLHLHRLLLGLAAADWLCALVGLQARRDLPAGAAAPAAALETAPPTTPPDSPLLDHGPAAPPPALPHRGPTPPPPAWMRRFAARGPLSYVRLGLEVLRAPDLGHILRRLVHWLGIYLRTWMPLWRPWQLRYRLTHWWPAAT